MTEPDLPPPTPDAPAPRLLARPLLLADFVRTACLVILTICVAGATLAMLKHLVAPLLVAVFLFYLIKPAVDRLSRRKTPTWVIIPFFVVVSFVVVMALVQIVYSNVRAFEARIPDYREKAIRGLESYYRMTGLAWPGDQPAEQEEPAAEGPEGKTEPSGAAAPAAKDPPPDAAAGNEAAPAAAADLAEPQAPGEAEAGATADAAESSPAGDAVEAAEIAEAAAPVKPQEVALSDLINFPWHDAVEYAFGSALGFLEGSLMTLFYVVFLFLESRKLPRRVARGFPRADSDHYLRVGENINRSIERYVVLKTYVNLGLAFTTGLICMAFGLDFWILWAVVMFLANYITYIGSVVALAPPVILGVLQFSPLTALALAALLIVNRLIWIDYIEIRYLGQQLNISPLLLLFSIALSGFLWGTAGMILAVPLITSFKIALSHFENTRRYAVLMSED